MSKSQLQPVTALPPKCHSLPNSHHCLSGRDILFLGTSVWWATSSIWGANIGADSGTKRPNDPTTNVPQQWNIPSVVKVDEKEITLKENQK